MKIVGVSHRSATTLSPALIKVVARSQARQQLQQRADANRVSWIVLSILGVQINPHPGAKKRRDACIRMIVSKNVGIAKLSPRFTRCVSVLGKMQWMCHYYLVKVALSAMTPVMEVWRFRPDIVKRFFAPDLMQNIERRTTIIIRSPWSRMYFFHSKDDLD